MSPKPYIAPSPPPGPPLPPHVCPHRYFHADRAECAAAPWEPWWTHHADHMKGWEAFGCTGSPPTVRRLGTVTFGRHHKGPATTEEKPGTEPFGPGEVALGVSGIMFSTHADDRTGGYLHVIGTTKEDVERRWRVAERAVVGLMPTLWPRSRMSR